MDKFFRGKDIELPIGKLGVLIVGLGAVSTTMLAGIFAARKRKARLLGSLTQTG